MFSRFSELKKEADSNEDLEVSFKEPSVKPVKESKTNTEENETPKIRRATKRTRSPGSRTKKSTTPISKVEKPVKEEVEEKEPESLDSDDDDSEENNNKENENEDDNKENSGPVKKSKQWKPVSGRNMTKKKLFDNFTTLSVRLFVRSLKIPVQGLC